MKKKSLFLLPCIAAVALAMYVGTKAFKSNASVSNTLLMANVEALSLGGDAPQKTEKAIEILTSSRIIPTGWKVGINISGSLRASLQKLIGQSVLAGSELHAEVLRYMLYDTIQIYQRNCIADASSNCICSDSNNGQWFDQPAGGIHETSRRCN
jgi:hypothetical protein